MKAGRAFFVRLPEDEIIAWFIYRDVERATPAELDPPFFERSIQQFRKLSIAQVIDLLTEDGYDVPKDRYDEVLKRPPQWKV